jgi:hypothetical protein
MFDYPKSTLRYPFCRPFDPSYYEDEIEEDEVLDEEGRARMKLKVTANLYLFYL